ncbi:hypothetical protein [endosymbiont GvMRE of Glomus versiforme]|uniref:hypothetical protein n=1 Tax=endosymbiont GvMRE of Glomus versiforme TaxID=2039283 RepID=UPI001559A145|nr:hypothetical protein [endosymbiont GvMRE of Glomus versiforme]
MNKIKPFLKKDFEIEEEIRDFFTEYLEVVFSKLKHLKMNENPASSMKKEKKE